MGDSLNTIQQLLLGMNQSLAANHGVVQEFVEKIGDKLALDNQNKAFWTDVERKYWVSWLKSFMAQDAEIKVLMQKGDI